LLEQVSWSVKKVNENNEFEQTFYTTSVNKKVMIEREYFIRLLTVNVGTLIEDPTLTPLFLATLNIDDRLTRGLGSH